LQGTRQASRIAICSTIYAETAVGLSGIIMKKGVAIKRKSNQSVWN